MGNKSWAIASLVCGILSLIVPFVGVILAILAIVFYAQQKKVEPSGMATAGMVLGIISLIGYVILIGLMLIGSMAYFGVMEPDRFLPDKCTMNPPFSCANFDVTSNEVSLWLTNHAGVNMDVVTVQLDCGSQAVSRNFENVENGQISSASWAEDLPEDCTLQKGEQFRASLTVTYRKEGETIDHITTGSIMSSLR